MAYDFHGKWERETGHNAPLYAPSSDSEWRKQLSVSAAAEMWTRLGAPKEKLIIVIAKTKSDIIFQGDQWVGFDDERSIRHKMKWIKENGFGGAMVWTVDMDDFTGTICGNNVKYPLIGAIREGGPSLLLPDILVGQTTWSRQVRTCRFAAGPLHARDLRLRHAEQSQTGRGDRHGRPVLEDNRSP
ncbi:unnamed protein product, partial [Nesidiocoris tenuis]